jgi:CheY-like chemotaxis protein
VRTARTLRLLICSKNPTLRAGVKKVLREAGTIATVGEVKSIRQTLREYFVYDPDLILLDADMAGVSTLDAIRRIRREAPSVSIWIYSLWEDSDLIAACLEAGASGVVPPEADAETLIQMMHDGRRKLSSKHEDSRGRIARVASWIIIAILSALVRGAAQTASSSEPPAPAPDGTVATPAERSKPVPAPEPSEEEQPPYRKGFYFTSPFAASGVREFHLPVGAKEVDGTATWIALPEMTFAHIEPRTEFLLSYHPSFELFHSDGELNAATHDARLRFARDLNPRWTVSFRDSYIRTEDPTRELQENVFLLPRTSFQENVAGLGFDYLRDARTKYSLDIDNTVSFLSLKDLLHNFPADRFDQVAGGVTAAMTRKVAVQERLTVSYSLLMFHDLHTGVPSSTRVAHGASLAWEHGFDQRGIYLELSGGVLRAGSTSYTALGRVGYNWRTFSAYLGYSREFAFVRSLAGGPDNAARLAGGLAPESISQVATLEIAGTIRGHVVVDLAGSVGEGASALSVGNIRSATARARLAYRVGRVFPFVGAEFYDQNFSPLTGSRMDRSRFMIGLSIALNSVPEAANLPTGDYSEKWPLSAPGLAARRSTRLEKGDLK